MVFSDTVCVCAARTLQRTWIDATISDARSICRTLIRSSAFEFPAGYLRITTRCWRTLTSGTFSDYRTKCIFTTYILFRAGIFAMRINTHRATRTIFAGDALVGPLATGGDRIAYQTNRTGAKIVPG